MEYTQYFWPPYLRLNCKADIDFNTLYALYEQEKKQKEELRLELMKTQFQLSNFSHITFGRTVLLQSIYPFKHTT